MHKTALLSNLMDEFVSHSCFFRAVIDQTVDLVTVTDLEGTILFVSPSIERLLGRTPRDRLGRNLFEFVHSDDVRRVRAAFDEAIQSGEPSKTIEYRYKHRDGDWRVLESIGTRFIDTRGVMLVLVQSRDATERRAREGQTAHTSAHAEAASLSGSIARDFNELLVVLARQVALLESRGESTARGDVQVMRAAIDRAAVLVTQLQAFAQVDGIPRGESTDVNRALEEMAADLGRVSGPGIEVIHLLGATEANARLGRVLLERVVVAIVARAREAMPTGGRLTILTRNTMVSRTPSLAHQTGDQVIIEMTDTGTALSDMAREQLFEPDAEAPGAQRGLHAARAIIQQAGGRIAVETALGTGTTIRVQLPLARS